MRPTIDVGSRWNRRDVSQLVTAAGEAVAAWRKVRGSPNAAVLAAAMLAQEQWGR